MMKTSPYILTRQELQDELSALEEQMIPRYLNQPLGAEVVSKIKSEINSLLADLIRAGKLPADFNREIKIYDSPNQLDIRIPGIFSLPAERDRHHDQR